MGAACATKGLLRGFRRASKRRVAFYKSLIRISGDVGATGSLLDLYSLRPQSLPEGVHVLSGTHCGTWRLCDEGKCGYSCWWALRPDLDAYSSRRKARRRHRDTKTHHAFVRSAGLQSIGLSSTGAAAQLPHSPRVRLLHDQVKPVQHPEMSWWILDTATGPTLSFEVCGIAEAFRALSV